MRASQKLQERCDWVRIVNKLDVDIAELKASPFYAYITLFDLCQERDAAIKELAKLGYVVPE